MRCIAPVTEQLRPNLDMLFVLITVVNERNNEVTLGTLVRERALSLPLSLTLKKPFASA